MTIQEMHWAIREGIQTMDAFTYDNYLPQQLDFLINLKINTFVKQQYLSQANMTGKGMEFKKENLHALQTLIYKNDNNIPAVLGTTYYLDLTSFSPELLFLISAEVKTTLVGSTTHNTVHGRIVEHEMLRYLLDNPFRTTSHLSPILTYNTNELDIYADEKFIVNSVNVTYIKKPAVVDSVNSPTVDCDLPEHTHQTIVDMVVQSILEKIESPRYQQNVAENMLNK